MDKILTSITARTVWQYLAIDDCKHLIKEPKHWGSALGINPEHAQEILAIGEDWFERLVDGVPDEFHKWLRDTVAKLQADVRTLHRQLLLEAAQIKLDVSQDPANHRADFARAVTSHPHKGALFLLLDGRSILTYLWKAAYPPPSSPFKIQSEDTA